jgi:alcohol dehydrogenase class IV
MVNHSFTLARTPEIHFGAGTFRKVPEIIGRFVGNIVLVTGQQSFRDSPSGKDFIARMRNDFSISGDFTINAEPSDHLIDSIVRSLSGKKPALVVAIGGGSVLDSAKAVSAMIPLQEPIIRYLEEVGDKQHPGVKIPFLAVPTTAGTGSESTKNAVISGSGKGGAFKRSLRHDNFVPDITVIDPELMLSCPPSITAACGLDAFTQLLESYVSTDANPLTDALAIDGMRAIARSLVPSCTDEWNNIHHRSGMAYGAMLSGITLANAGLGVVHGLAAPAGALTHVPHGVFCARVLPTAVEWNIHRLKQLGNAGNHFLEKYTHAGFILNSGDDGDVDTGCDILIKQLWTWVQELEIPGLSGYLTDKEILRTISEQSGNKNNPVELTCEERLAILLKCL